MSSFLKMLPRPIAFVLAVLVNGTIASAQFLPMELRSISPSGATIGSTATIRVVGGDRIDEVERLHFSHPGLTATLQTLDPLPFTETRVPHYGHFDVSVAADVPPGRYEVRAVGRHGVSNPRYFLVSPLPNVLPTVSQDATQPTPLPFQTFVHGQSSGTAPQHFSVTVGSQPVRVELLAHRLDSRMIGQLQWMDANGRLLDESHGAEGLDPHLAIQSLEPGTYRLVVNDYLYRGGDEYHYQLVVLDGTSVLPVLEPVWGESQTPAEPQPITLPHDQSWWLAPEHAVYVFEFQANEGQSIGMEILSQQLGEPTDLRLSVKRVEIDSSGNRALHDLLVADDSRELSDNVLRLTTRDPTAFFTAPMTGTYVLLVRDLDDGQAIRQQQRFRLRVQLAQPRFELVAYPLFPHNDTNQARPFGSKLYRGGCEAIRVFAIRRDGFAGPIAVTAEDLPAGVSASPVIIAPDQSQNDIVLTAAEDATMSVRDIRIIGRNEESSLTVTSTTQILNQARDGWRDTVQSRSTSQLTIGVSEIDTSPISIAWANQAVVDVKKGESLSLVCKLTRREGASDAVVLRPRNLPSGASAVEVTIPADQSEGTLQIQVPAAVAGGIHSFSVQAETKINVKPNPQSLARSESYRAHLQKLHDDPARAGELDAIKAAIATADQRVEASRPAANPQSLTVFIPSPSLSFRVIDP